MSASKLELEIVEVAERASPPPSGPAIRLFNRSGERLALSQEEWRLLLRTAQMHGWVPTGARHRPQRIDLDDTAEDNNWDGGYESAAGQMVERRDARRLVEALERALLARPRQLNGFCRTASQLTGFCKGGFLIC